MARLLKGGLPRNRLRLPVVELAMRVDVQPTSRMAVLVALDLAVFALPLVEGGGYVWSVTPTSTVGTDSATVSGICVGNPG